MTLDAMLTPPEPESARCVSFAVLGVPIPQGSLRAFARRDGGRPIVTGDNPRTRPWKSAVTAAALDARQETFLGPVAVSLTFRLPRPLGHYGSGRNRTSLRPSAPACPIGKPDLDKLARAVLDALTDAGIWRDDSQVVRLDAAKGYDQHGLVLPGLIVLVTEVPT